MTGVTSGAGTAYPSGAPQFISGFQWVSCSSVFSFMYIFCRSLFVLLSLFFWPLCCLFFFDLRILITPFVSSISSWILFGKGRLLPLVEPYSYLKRRRYILMMRGIIRQCRIVWHLTSPFETSYIQCDFIVRNLHKRVKNSIHKDFENQYIFF